MAAYPRVIQGYAGDDEIVLRWIGSQLCYKVTTTANDPSTGQTTTTTTSWNAVLEYDPDNNSVFDGISVIGAGGTDTLILDFLNGDLTRGAVTGIDYNGGGGVNELVVKGGAGDDVVTFGPGPGVWPAGNAFEVDGTAVSFGVGVRPPRFRLGGGGDAVVVRGDGAGATASVTWDDALFEPGQNGALSLSVGAGGRVAFADGVVLAGLEVDVAGGGVVDVGEERVEVMAGGADGVAAVAGRVRGYLRAGLGVARPTRREPGWAGAGGIVSGWARGHFPMTVALEEDVAGGRVAVRPGLYGDADLDGAVGAADYAAIDAGMRDGLGGWGNGDFDHSGAVDWRDYLLADQAWVLRGGAMTDGWLAGRAGRFGEGYVGELTAAVPEPGGTAGALAWAAVLGAGAVGGRRRGRRGRMTND